MSDRPDRVLVQISHPAHVHFYKNFLEECERRGIQTKVITKDKEISTELLDALGYEYTVVLSQDEDRPITPKEHILFEFRVLREAKQFNPDVMTAVGGTAISHSSTFLRIPSVVFTDSEAATFGNKITIPFADLVCTPSNYREDYGNKHVRYDGYHELAYLHPNQFESDPKRLVDHGVDVDETYFIVRFIAWGAQHDIGHGGLSLDQKRRLVSDLSEVGTVYITAESDLPPDLEQYQLPIPSHLLHDLLYHADLYIGDSQTMATEAAILGTPAIRSNTFAGDGDMSNFVELEEEYRLLYSTPDGEEAIRKALTWAKQDGLQDEWQNRRQRLLEDKTDVTRFITQVILDPNEWT